MKRIATIAVLSSLIGCASSQSLEEYRASIGTPEQQAERQARTRVQQQCEYEAEIAIQSIGNPLYAGYRKSELMRMCMTAKGY